VAQNVHQAFQRAVQRAVDALHVAFGPVGEQLRRERDAQAQEIAEKVVKYLKGNKDIFYFIDTFLWSFSYSLNPRLLLEKLQF